jgi:glycosyltransferase involved in cell wall biosynthesis
VSPVPADAIKPQRPTITGVVLTRDGERLIGKCLASLSFCDTVLVVDSGSADNTVAIARDAGAVVIENPWPGFAAQFTFAADAVTTDWFFILDQDEWCAPELGKAILEHIHDALRADNDMAAPMTAFSISRRSWYFDRFMKHGGWYPDHILRVFKTGFVAFSQDAHVHYHPKGGSSHIASGEVVHYPYTGFFHQLAKLNVYAEQGASAMRASGKKGGIPRGVGHALARFFRIYVLKAGFLDGRAGFLAAAHGAFYAFSKYVRVLESDWGSPFDRE